MTNDHEQRRPAWYRLVACSAPASLEIRLRDDQVGVAPLDHDLNGGIFMAWGDYEPVDGFHCLLVLAQRQLDRLGTCWIVALTCERDRLLRRHVAGVFDRCAALVVSLERLLILLSPL